MVGSGQSRRVLSREPATASSRADNQPVINFAAQLLAEGWLVLTRCVIVSAICVYQEQVLFICAALHIGQPLLIMLDGPCL